jgi:hypothetical protein
MRLIEALLMKLRFSYKRLAMLPGQMQYSLCYLNLACHWFLSSHVLQKTLICVLIFFKRSSNFPSPLPFSNQKLMTIPVRTLATVAGLSLSAGSGYYFINKNNKAAAVVTESVTPSVKKPKFYDSRPFTLLTATDIDERLRSGQFANKIQTQNVKAIYSNQLPSNNPVEDNYSIHTFSNGLIAGVYDGKFDV